MGCIDTVTAGSRTLTVQTEFFPRPDWRVETKIYIGGALKKVYTDPVDGVEEDGLQAFVNSFHQARLEELRQSLSNLKK
ncbi:MAG TPA: hypothetical protein VM534_00660 [Thermoanaerobaculia bacterium]|nr:hypothetical protein [Thermoanaerobaculia bacterium]